MAGALGAGVVAASGGDAEEAAVGGLVGALWANAIKAAFLQAGAANRMFWTPGSTHSLAYAGLAGWAGQPNDRAIGAVGRWLRRSAVDLRRRGAGRALVSPIEGVQHFMEGFDHGMWQQLHNGSKLYYFDSVFGRVRQELADAGKLGKNLIRDKATGMVIDEELLRASREIMQQANNFFGGQQFSRLLAKPEMQFLLRRAQLSPDWGLSQLIGAGNLLLNMTLPQQVATSAIAGGVMEMVSRGFELDEMTVNGVAGGALMGGLLGPWANRVRARIGARGDVMAKEARRLYRSALVGGFFFMNLLNMAFQGRPMWENPEGDTMKVMLPDGSRLGLGKAWLEVFEFAGAVDEERFPVPVLSRAESKLAVLPRLGTGLLFNRGVFGPIISAGEEPWEKAGDAMEFAFEGARPITLSNVFRPLQQVGSGRDPAEALGQAGIGAEGFQIGSPRRERRLQDARVDAIRSLATPPGVGATAFRPTL